MKLLDDIRFQNVSKTSAIGILEMLPIILGVILLVSIINVIIPASLYQRIFTGNLFFDAFKGAILGSVLTGNPVTGYILADAFAKAGVNMIAITAFLVSWVTVGLVQLPAESLALGKKFAFYRNLTSFLMSIIVAVITILIIKYI